MASLVAILALAQPHGESFRRGPELSDVRALVDEMNLELRHEVMSLIEAKLAHHEEKVAAKVEKARQQPISRPRRRLHLTQLSNSHLDQ